jgi:hypothetical protein
VSLSVNSTFISQANQRQLSPANEDFRIFSPSRPLGVPASRRDPVQCIMQDGEADLHEHELSGFLFFLIYFGKIFLHFKI